MQCQGAVGPGLGGGREQPGAHSTVHSSGMGVGPSFLWGHPTCRAILPMGPSFPWGHPSHGAVLPAETSLLQGHPCCRILCLAMETRHQHICEYTRIKIIGCYRNRRQIILFADSSMVLCQIIGCQRAMGILHPVLLQLSSVTTESMMLRKQNQPAA